MSVVDFVFGFVVASVIAVAFPSVPSILNEWLSGLAKHGPAD